MNKKGFTLIELIVTIALIGIVGVVISINMVKVINSQRENEELQAIKIAEEAACAYASLSTSYCETGCTVYGNMLISAGLIDEEINGVGIKNMRISVSYVNGERICRKNN